MLEFYPTLFVLATDVMDMVGDMVWERIKQKAEFSEGGNVISSLPGFITFMSSDLILFLCSFILTCALHQCMFTVLYMHIKLGHLYISTATLLQFTSGYILPHYLDDI